MTTPTRKRHVVRSLKLNEISTVDHPAQVGAVAVFMKRLEQASATDDPNGQIDALSREYMAAVPGTTFEQAFSAIMETTGGQRLLKAAVAADAAKPRFPTANLPPVAQQPAGDAEIRKSAQQVADTSAEPLYKAGDYEAAMLRRAGELASEYGISPENALAQHHMSDPALRSLTKAYYAADALAYGATVAKRQMAHG